MTMAPVRWGGSAWPGILYGMGQRSFASEDAAAEFIARVKRLDPDDDFTYVISADPQNAGQFIIEIFAPDGRFVGRV